MALLFLSSSDAEFVVISIFGKIDKDAKDQIIPWPEKPLEFEFRYLSQL